MAGRSGYSFVALCFWFQGRAVVLSLVGRVLSRTELCGMLNVFVDEEFLLGWKGPQEWDLRMSGRRACLRLGCFLGKGWKHCICSGEAEKDGCWF